MSTAPAIRVPVSVPVPAAAPAAAATSLPVMEVETETLVPEGPMETDEERVFVVASTVETNSPSHQSAALRVEVRVEVRVRFTDPGM